MKLRSLRSDHILALPLCIVALALPAAGCRDPEGGGGGSSGTDGTGTADDATSEPDGGTVDDTGTDSEDIPDIDVIPPPGGMRRLTPAQYVDSVGLMLGSAAADAADPPPLPQLGTFDSETASIEPLTPVDIEQYESSAMAIGTAVMSDLSGLAVVAPCVNSSPDAACYTTIAQQLGRYAWRRPLIDEEVSTLAAIGVAAQEWGGGDFLTGVRYEVSAILQSPNFLYVMEVGEVGEDGVTRQLDQYELASRMSFFLVGHTPDLALLDAAEAGSLGTNSEIEAVATELLDRPEARDRLSEFYGELYRLRDLETKGKDETLFPTFSPELAAAMRQETLLLIQNVVFEEQSSFLNIFDATYTFVNDDLAALYGMTPPAFPWQLVPLPVEQGRAGFLTQGAFLSVFSHPDINSPTRRGLFVQETLLCTDIQPPPPEVNPTPPAPVDGQTIREWLEETHNEGTCATCHGLIDPLGFAFERFDAIGAYRQLDNGQPIDSSGGVDGLGSFANAAELAGLIRNDPRTPNCVVRNLYRSTLGHDAGIDQAEGIALLDESFTESEYNYKSLMVELTLNPLFRLVDAPK